MDFTMPIRVFHTKSIHYPSIIFYYQSTSTNHDRDNHHIIYSKNDVSMTIQKALVYLFIFPAVHKVR